MAAGFGRRRVVGLLFQLHRKPESGAFARFAFYADLTLHEDHQLFGNRQSQAGAAIFARGRTIGLAKRLKKLPLSFRGKCQCRCLLPESVIKSRRGF